GPPCLTSPQYRLVKHSGPPRPRRLASDASLHGPHDFAEPVRPNAVAGAEYDVPPVVIKRQRRLWLDLERDPAEGSKILEHDFEVGVKIAGQLVGPEDVESAIVGARFGQIERLLDVAVIDGRRMSIASHHSYSYYRNGGRR